MVGPWRSRTTVESWRSHGPLAVHMSSSKESQRTIATFRGHRTAGIWRTRGPGLATLPLVKVGSASLMSIVGAIGHWFPMAPLVLTAGSIGRRAANWLTHSAAGSG